MSETACRHYKGVFFDNRPSCAMGRDVRKWATRMNGGSNLGIGLRLPCTKPTGEKPLWDCPECDRKTNAEVEAEKAAMRTLMDELVSILPKFEMLRTSMKAEGQSGDQLDCYWCDAKDSMLVSVSPTNGHMHVKCKACDKGFME